MASSDSSGEITRKDGQAFVTTLWTVVLNAREEDSAISRDAMGQLCRTYWYPLYAYVRRSGHAEHDAEDLTQEFFARFLSKDYLGSVDQQKGRFRSFLLACLKHFLMNEWKREHRIKRGGHQQLIPLDSDSAETRYLAEFSTDLTPDKFFDRRWALTVLERALSKLRQEHIQAGKTYLFEALKPFLTAETEPPAQVQLAAQLGMNTDSLKMAVSRLRRRYRELLRGEIAETVATPEQVDEEWHYLVEALT